MEFGIKTQNNECFCKKCGKKLDINPQSIFNFCPFCSSPLNLVAYNFKMEQQKEMKFEVVKELIGFTTQKTTLADLQNYLNKISQE